jgi:L-ascorbate metabolism protein UlaG (beta-lactamase superfamily)
MKRALLVLLVLVAAAAAWLVVQLRDRPSLEPYRDRFLAPLIGEPASGLRATFLGVTTLLFDDGETAILTDGFFSRPGILALVRPIAPDREAIAAALARAGISRLAAVIPVHSHYDHAMDAPEVARRTGAMLVGSESTANVGRGDGLPEDRIRVVADGDTLTFGRFRVTMILSRHFPHGMAMGEIREPLRPPARATDYLDGGAYSIFIEHDGRTLLVQGSAGYIEGKLAGRQADTVFLGVAGLSQKDDAYRQAYWREVVQVVRPNRIVPIHWDDFTRPLDEPLVAAPRMVDDLEANMRFVLERAESAGIDVRFADAWVPIDPLRLSLRARP